MQRHQQQRPPPPSGGPPPPPRPIPAAHSSSSSFPPTAISATTFSENQLPSVKSKFYTVEEERTIRAKTCRFISEVGKLLLLPRLTTSTAMVMLHRFYAVHSFEDHDRFEVAVACILLAAKTEESPKKLTTVIQECHRLKTMSARKNNGSSGGDGSLDVKSQEFIRLKERTLLLERVILHTIGFELSIDHPHKFIGEIVTKLILSNQIEFIESPFENKVESKSRIQETMKNLLVKKSISFANDSMLTYLCLQFPANKIATAVIFMSAQANKMRPTKNRSWADLDTIISGGSSNENDDSLDIDSLTSIVKQIMELIGERKGLDKSIFSRIESGLKTIKQEYNSGGDRDAKRQRTSK